MRKALLSLLAISFFIYIFSGCTQENKKSPVIFFEACAQVQSNDIKCNFKLNSSSSKDVMISVDNGDFKGLQYHRINSTLYIKYNGLECVTKTDYLPSDSYVDVMIDVVVSMQTTDLKYIKSEGDSDVYKGRIDDGEYLVYCSSDNGFVQKIVPKYCDYVIILSAHTEK